MIGELNQRGESIPSRIYPVFRDEEELAAGRDLTVKIYNALERAKTLVVLCSTEAPSSTYVDAEVRYFKGIGKTASIYAAIISGSPDSECTEGTCCFPRSLLFEVDEESQDLGATPSAGAACG